MNSSDWKLDIQKISIPAQMFKVMKMTIFLLTLFFVNVFADTNAQQITIRKDQISLKGFFQEVRKQTGYHVLLESATVPLEQSYPAQFENIGLKEALNAILKDAGLTYIVKDNTIIVKEGTRSSLSLMATLQTNRIRGTVKDQNNNALSGVSVTAKNSQLIATTNEEGGFELLIPTSRPETLVFTYLGMEPQEVVVDTRNPVLSIVMKPSQTEIEDVVVTGYGNIRKESFTGSYTQISREDILKVTSGNLITALQVYDPSFRIVQNNELGSDPNNLPEFYIRGQSGFPGVKDLDRIEGTTSSQFALQNNPNLPIFIMDGFEISLEKVFDMDINRIAEITILKDAAATAVYGSRASNGVVVIETIAPKPGELHVTYSGNFQLTHPDLTSYNMMNAQEKLEAEVAAGIFLPHRDVLPKDYANNLVAQQWYYLQKRNEVNKGVDTYWLSQPLTTMFNNKHNLYVEVGSEAIRLGVDFRYDNQNGVMKESSRDRIGAGLTVNYILRNLQIRNQVSYDVMKAKDSPYGSFADYSRLQPYYNIHSEADGELIRVFPNWTGQTDANPLYEASLGNFSRNDYSEWTNNFSANLNLTTGLQIRGQFAVNYKTSGSEVFTDPLSTTYARSGSFERGDLRLSTTDYLNWNANLFGSYNRVFGDHNFNAALGVNARATDDDYIHSRYRGFPEAAFHTPAYAYEIIQKPSLDDNKTRLLGGFSTLNYSVRDIYLFDASFRLDGSSEFGTDRKWAPFWSLGTGLNLHNYAGLKNIPNINVFRIKANVGQTGKSNFSPFMARNTYNMLLDDWYPTGIGANLVFMGNNDLTWEKQVSWNFGTDITFKQYNSLEFNYYIKTTYDLITDVSLPSSSGFNVYRDNIGKVMNKGFEIMGSASPIRSRNFDLILFGNLAHNRNEILEIAESLKAYNQRIDDYYSGYYNNAERNNNHMWLYSDNERNLPFARPIMKYEEGNSLTTIYGMRSLGINPANGKEVFLRNDGTITYDWASIDQQAIGNTEPWAQGSFGFNVRFKQFLLYTTFLYEWGGDAYNTTLVQNVENVNLAYYNADRRVLTDRWRQPGDITPLKSIDDRYFVTRSTSRFVQKNNFVVFNSLSLGYEFDPAMLRNYNVSTFRLSLLMNDLGRMSTIQREMGLSYPFARTYTLTLNASF